MDGISHAFSPEAYKNFLLGIKPEPPPAPQQPQVVVPPVQAPPQPVAPPKRKPDWGNG